MNDSIMQAVNKECPDVILLVCKATEVHSATQEDINICESIHKEIRNKHRRILPVIGVLTKCDEVAPKKASLPTNNEKKNSNIQQSVQDIYAYLKQREDLALHVKDVVPTVASAEYEDGKNGLILPEEDERWNITKLVETVMKYTPNETRSSLARMANITRFQLQVARTIVTTSTVLCGFISTNPIPGASIPMVAVIQTFMVTYIGWLGGREFSEQTLKDFFVATGLGIGTNIGMAGIADVALKVVPVLGSLLSASASTIATKGLGDAAIVYFIDNASDKRSSERSGSVQF